jgi:predicted Ser/Thr protein kinase
MATGGPESLLAGRYRIVRRLGGGSTADVHEAFDVALGASVALKQFRERSAASLRSLKAEFRKLADIQHPGLVKLFDLVVAADTAFFTMELVEGTTFVEYARAAPDDDLRRTVRQMADAVATLHAHGTLHRDLKPANVLVTAEGGVRVLDFGLASVHGAAPMAGTLAYMAPEVFEGAMPGAPTDWYGLGVVLYEAVTGRLPAGGADIAEMVLRKRLRRFARPRELAPDLAPDLDDLVWALLDPDPASRASHASIVSWLGGVPGSAEVPADGAARFIGRGPELARLGAALQSASAGATTCVVVEGPSGIGKTALVRAFLGTDEASRCTVVRGAARPQEHVPFRAFDAVVDDLASVIEALPDGMRAGVSSQISPSLVRSFPVLASLRSVGAEPDARLEALEARRDAQGSLARVLRALASTAPLIVWIDDIQWADYESLLFVRSALDRHDAPVLFVLSRRPGLLPWPDHESWLASAARVELAPLDASAAMELLRARALDPAPSSRALEEAAGNAFLIEFFARHATAAGGSEDVLDLGTALRSALLGLAPDARRLFECITLAQRPLPLSWLGGLVEDRTRLRDQVAVLSSGRLVSVDEQGRVRPYHDALRERAERLLDDTVRLHRHGGIADVLRAHDAPPEWQVPHLEGAGRLEAASDACLLAGDGASDTHAFEIAARFFQKALDLGKLPSGGRARTLEKLSDNLALMGRGREAATGYGEAARIRGPTDDPQAILAIEHKRALALLRTGALEEGRGVLRSVLRGVGERLPGNVASALGTFFVERGRLAVERRAAKKTPTGPIDAPTQLRLDALWTAATGLGMYQPLLANALTARFVRQALRAGDPRRVVRALGMEAVYLAALGGRYRAEADAVDADLRARFEDIPWGYERSWIAACLGTGSWLAGDVRACRDWTVRSRKILLEVPESSAFELALLDAWRLPAMALVGDFDAAVSGAEDMLAVANERGDQFASLPCLHGYVTQAYLARGNLELAVTRAEEGRRRAAQLASPLPALHQTWSWTTIALYSGQGERAHETVRSDWPRLRRSGALVFESAVGDMRDLRARATLAAARSAPPRSKESLLREALDQARWLAASSLRCGAAMSLSIEAQVAGARGRGAEAFELGARASRAFDALGLAPPRDALARWVRGAPAEPVDAVFVMP